LLYPFDAVYNMEKFWMIAVLLGAIVCTAALTVFVHCSNLPRPPKSTLYALQAAILAAQTGQFLSVVSTPAEMGLFIAAQNTALCLAGPSFFFYCHSAVTQRYPGLRQVLSVGWVPFLGMAMVLSNGAHHWFYTLNETVPFNLEYNCGYACTAACNYLLVLGGLVRIYVSQRHRDGPDRRLAGAGIVALLFVALLDGWEYASSWFAYDLTPASLAAFQAAAVVGNRGEIGYKAAVSNKLKALDCINEAVVITDRQHNVLYASRSRLNDLLNIRENSNLARIIESRTTTAETCDAGAGSAALVFSSLPAPLHCSYYIQPIGKDGDDSGGMLHVLRDVSEYKALIDRLEEERKELTALTGRLQTYAGVVARLAEEKERQRIIRDVNAVIGQSIREIACNLERLESLQEGELALMKEIIGESIDSASQALQTIRGSVGALAARGAAEIYRSNRGEGVGSA